MPAFYAGKRVGKPLLNGHTYNALFNGKLVWLLDRDTVVSIEITDDKGKPLPKSLAVSGTLKLGAKATYADGHVGDLLTTKNVTFTSRTLPPPRFRATRSRGGMAARFSSRPLSTVSPAPPRRSPPPTRPSPSRSRTIPANPSTTSPCASARARTSR